MNRLELSVVIPVYNEEKRVPKTLAAVFSYLKSKRKSAEVLVVDDGSKDRTVETVLGMKKLAGRGQSLKVMRQGVNRGKGAAVRLGALAAKGNIVLYMDADNSTPLSEVEGFQQAFREGAQVVMGSRAVDRSTVQIHQPFHREAMGRVFNLLVQIAAVPGLWDTQCGFKAFRREAAQAVFSLQTIKGFGFDVEILFIARKKGFLIREVPVRWFDSPQSKVHVLRDSTRMFLDLWTIRRNDWKGLYDGSGKTFK